MPQQYYNLEKVAEMLGVSPAEANRMRERNELRAFRDGADWKFKVEDVQEYLAKRIKGSGSAETSADDSDEVLISELDLGGADSGTSGTVIGPIVGDSPESDVQLTDSEIKLAGSGLHLSEDLAQPGGLQAPTPSDIAKADDLELTLDADLTLEDSHVPLTRGPAPVEFASGDSSIELAEPAEFEDDDLVLGGSSGSDITIGGDSGISLVDPTDSGLSLEEPLAVGDGSESLELGEDDMLSVMGGSSVVGSESPTQLKSDSEFLLTPTEEAVGEDTESSSQVIALDADSEVDDSAATMATNMQSLGISQASDIAGPSMSSMAHMLDEDSSVGAGIDIEPPATAPMIPAAGSTAGVQRCGGRGSGWGAGGSTCCGRASVLGALDHEPELLHVVSGIGRHDGVRPDAQHVELERAVHV